MCKSGFIRERASEQLYVSSVQQKSAILYMYSFSMVRSCEQSMNNLDSATNSTFHAGGSSPLMPRSVLLYTHTVEEKETN